MIKNTLYITGGLDHNNHFSSIHSWDPSAESWQAAGELAVERGRHAAVAVSNEFEFCKKN